MAACSQHSALRHWPHCLDNKWEAIVSCAKAHVTPHRKPDTRDLLAKFELKSRKFQWIDDDSGMSCCERYGRLLNEVLLRAKSLQVTRAEASFVMTANNSMPVDFRALLSEDVFDRGRVDLLVAELRSVKRRHEKKIFDKQRKLDIKYGPKTKEHSSYRPTQPSTRAQPNLPVPTGIRASASHTLSDRIFQLAWADRFTQLDKRRFPDTPDGHAQYRAAIEAFVCNHSEPDAVKATVAFPLTPGTASAGEPACWTCGKSGHMASTCQSAKPVPRAERNFCRVWAMAKRDPRNTRQVNIMAKDKQDIDAHLASFLLLAGSPDTPAAKLASDHQDFA
ncbi:hypothetical protein OIV83_004881 [Microbotryomycetes sp. JL201]|nr:hypothetical protein OIV83_004881 [Microbotryomycetes sp. JL201]